MNNIPVCHTYSKAYQWEWPSIMFLDVKMNHKEFEDWDKDLETNSLRFTEYQILETSYGQIFTKEKGHLTDSAHSIVNDIINNEEMNIMVFCSCC